MGLLFDIEDFTTDELRRELNRRLEADRKGRCWYCGKNLAAHTCKYAIEDTPVPGWEVEPPRFVRTEDCMANEVEYWQVDARNPTTGRHATATAGTRDGATRKLIERLATQRS